MWLVIISSIVNSTILIFSPRRLTLKEIYISWWVITLLALYTDQSLGGVYHLYNYGKSGVDIIGMIIHLFHEPLFGIVYLNFLPKEKYKLIPYIVGWVIFSTFYEWLVTLTGFLRYTNWELYYSAMVYLLVFLFLRWHIKFIRS